MADAQSIALLPMGALARDHVVSAGRMVQALRVNGLPTVYEGRQMLVIPSDQLATVEKLLSAALATENREDER